MKNEKVLNKYLENNILMAPPEKLVLMLYNGCIKNINFAKKGLIQKNIEDVNNCINKAQDIIFELKASLDFNYSIAKEMDRLYTFIIDTLIDANIYKEVDKLDVALKLITEFRDTWVEVIKINQENLKVTRVG